MTEEMIKLKPVGVVRTVLTNDEVKELWHKGTDSEIEIFEDYAPALEGIEEFSHIIVLSYLHETTDTQRKTLQARPRRFLKYGMKLEDLPLMGVFCLDSPHWPNPIGLTIVQLLARDGNILTVNGLDAFNNTPVLDIKPYTPERCITQFRLPHWFQSLLGHLQNNEG